MPAEKDPRMPRSMPGPIGQGLQYKLPTPLAPGVMPPDDSRLWQFSVPKAIQQGESYIQDDTRDWFEARDRKVVIQREYPDHPRWIIDGKNSIRAKMFNAGIACEIHMLARINAGLPEYPAWVPARMSVKQQQADVAFRLTKAARAVWIEHGKEAMQMFAQKQPGQFCKFVAQTFIPRKIETDVTVSPGQALDPAQADELLAALSEELRRRQDEAKVINSTAVLELEDGVGVLDAMAEATDTLEAAVGAGSAERMGVLRQPGATNLARNLNRVVDLNADTVEWD